MRVGIFFMSLIWHSIKLCIFANNTANGYMKLITTLRWFVWISAVWSCMVLASCWAPPKTNIEKIADLKEQVFANTELLQDLESTVFKRLEKNFLSCDSMLQYLEEDQVDDAFEQLRLVQAYLEQFKVVNPRLKADLDSTLLQLDRLKSDAETNHFSDSLVTVYLHDETEHLNLLSNQVQYFKDRFGVCDKNLLAFRKKYR